MRSRLPAWFTEPIDPVPPDQELRVSSVELFFDLVFVFTITQLTSVLSNELNGVGVARMLLIFGVIWWMYAGYAWLTNAVPPTRPARQVILLLGMAGFLLVALAIPGAFDGDGVAFALGYLAVVAIHGVLYLQASAAFWRVLPFNVTAGLVILLAGFLHGPVRYAPWVLALVLLWASPYVTGQEGFPLNPAHIVERHGLVIIVALGESVVAVGIGAAQLPVNAGLILAALLGLALSACLWWIYFAEGSEAAAERLRQADETRRTLLVLGAYFYAHIPMLLGVVVLATGVKKAVGHATAPLATAPAVAMSAGVVLFLLGDAMYRRALRLGGGGARLVAAPLILAAVPLGRVAAAAQMVAVVAVLVTVVMLERPHARLAARSAHPV